MTGEEFLKRMTEIYAEPYDTESAHVNADALMVEAIEQMGAEWKAGVDVFLMADKWYA